MAAPPTAPRRCLTDAELAAVRAAPPGQAPVALALHLASCERCQQRALFGGGAPPAVARRKRPDPPSLRRTLLLAVLALGAVVAFFWTLRQLVGQIR
jgi:hypothetical protein